MRVQGEGAVPARVMFVGERPGFEENQQGRPFVGKSGRELERFLNGYDLPVREDVYITNLVKDYAEGNADPLPHEIARDAEELQLELRMVQPEIIVALGRFAIRYFLGDVDVETVHGIPHRITLSDEHENVLAEPILFPCFHPAAALHSPALQATLAYDMQRLALCLKGRLSIFEPDRVRETYVDYTGKVYVSWTTPADAQPAIDTEGLPGRAWGLSLSTEPGNAVVVRAKFPEALDATRKAIDAWLKTGGKVTLHNSLHDLTILRELGIHLGFGDFDDTMVMAYLLGIEPQGLKPLAYRYAGMQQDSYDDIVGGAREFIARQWLSELIANLPDAPLAKSKRTKKLLKQWEAEYGPGGEPPNTDPVLGKVKSLILRMLVKEGDDLAPLRKRWFDGRAREILIDETQYLSIYDDMPDATLDDVPLGTAIRYSARDADATQRIFAPLSAQIDAMGLREAYEIDRRVVTVVDRMQMVGLKADVEHFRTLVPVMQSEMARINDEIAALTGAAMNPNSGDQVAALLYDQLKVQHKARGVRLKRTDGGRFSTNDKTLNALKDTHAVVPLIMEYREVSKLLGTYILPMPKLVQRDGRLHPRYRITRTDTGRLAAGEPNVLAFPKHSERGKWIRDGFIADDGHELGEWDLKQIEMCVFAHDSNDEAMIAEILSGVDKHAATASRIFGRPADIIYAEDKAGEGEGPVQRFSAKAVNFGILMGITAFGLLDQFHKNGQLQWTLDDCEKLLAEWMKAYPQGASYIHAKHAEARRYGYVRDMFGRLRWLPGVHSDDERIAAEALRQAQATPIQSGAQGIIKRGMVALWPMLEQLRRDGIWVELLLQIHDALMHEYDTQARLLIDAVVREAMTNAVRLRVPIGVSAKHGQRWGEL